MCLFTYAIVSAMTKTKEGGGIADAGEHDWKEKKKVRRGALKAKFH